jgi:hypothetical protein
MEIKDIATPDWLNQALKEAGLLGNARVESVTQYSKR